MQWFWKQWADMLGICDDSVPTIGFTWYFHTDQRDWDTSVLENNGTVNALGLYDLNYNIRPVGEAYKCIIRDWKEILPTHTPGIFSQIPIVMPGENHPFEELIKLDGSKAARRHSANLHNIALI